SLSLRTLHRQLKQHTGLTPQRYLNRLRLIKARHLLRHSDHSVMLSPGAVQIFYGDESARPFGPTGSDPLQGTRSDMNWQDVSGKS
ncbi:helix-turn-helix domain-containing protein, partial [Salmonella enterica subsp. enterica serovar Cerro]|nr:helix-turn-helix domain-containing protein [Salmonella enterica subsp. enterica serovar Cerro]